VSITACKTAWTSYGAPNAGHANRPRLKVADAAFETWLKMPVPGERGENVILADLSLTVASSAATGAVTFTLQRAASRVPWSNPTKNALDDVGVVGASVSVTLTDPAPGDVLTFPTADFAALVQHAVDGKNYGWRLTSDSADVTRFYGGGTDSGPSFDFAATEAPAEATDLVPNGVGSVGAPVLQWNPTDLNGGDAQVSLRVQVASVESPAEDADGIWTASLLYDSGEVTDSSPELDLSATAFTPLTDGGECWWQLLWKSESGLWSPVSETAHYVCETKPTWTLTNPTTGEVDSAQPVLAGTFSGTLKSWRATLALTSQPNRLLATSGKQRATANAFAWQPQGSTDVDSDPLTLDDGETYRLVVDGWRPASGGYVTSAGDPVYVREVVDFTVNVDTGVEAPVITAIAPHASLPVNVVTLTRSTMPDTLVLVRDGGKAQVFDAADAHISGTTYQVVDALGRGMREHAYRARAQVDGSGVSALSNEVTATLVPKGMWFVSQDLTRSFVLGGPPPGMPRVDSAGVFVTQGREGDNELVVIRSGRGKVDTVVSGQLASAAGERSEEDQLDDFEAMLDDDEWVHFIAGNISMRVRLLHPDTAPNEHMREGRNWNDISVRVVEVG
jgi:hypothetical protein